MSKYSTKSLICYFLLIPKVVNSSWGALMIAQIQTGPSTRNSSVMSLGSPFTTRLNVKKLSIEPMVAERTVLALNSLYLPSSWDMLSLSWKVRFLEQFSGDQPLGHKLRLASSLGKADFSPHEPHSRRLDPGEEAASACDFRLLH